MSTDGAGLTDDVQAELNPKATALPADQPDRIPDRPADGAAKAKWVDYVVALGASRDVAVDTEHWEGDPDDGHPVTVPALTRDELVELADRLGG